MSESGPLGRLMHVINAPSVQPTGAPPRTVGGGYGVVPAAEARVNTTKRVPDPRPLSPREAQTLMVAEMAQACRELVASTTELTSRIGRHGATNGVLDVVLLAVPEGGVWTRDYPVTVGSVGIVNHSDTALIAHSGPAGSSAPNEGRGVQKIEPRSYLVFPVGQRVFSVWGEAGAQISVQVFTGMQPWGGGGL